VTRLGRLLAFCLVGGVAQAAPVTQVHWVMGTYLRITAEGDELPAGLRACFADARRLDEVFSRFDPESELSRLHRMRTQRASRDFVDLLGRSLMLGRRTGGAFDVTAGALTALWRSGRVPTPAAIAAARATVGGVARSGEDVRIAPGTALDFDGVAKGYAVDACVTRLRQVHVRHAFVSFGESSLYALGSSPDGEAWEVAVRGLDPDTAIGTLHLRDQAVSVSATRGAARWRKVIVDPVSGKALDDDRLVVVVAPAATEAEAYSKALLVWGSKSVARLERFDGVQAMAVSRQGIETGRALRSAGTFTSIVPGPRPLRRVEDGLP
jgi:thiamine biosynthesis lipoprotein